MYWLILETINLPSNLKIQLWYNFFLGLFFLEKFWSLNSSVVFRIFLFLSSLSSFHPLACTSEERWLHWRQRDLTVLAKVCLFEYNFLYNLSTTSFYNQNFYVQISRKGGAMKWISRHFYMPYLEGMLQHPIDVWGGLFDYCKIYRCHPPSVSCI